MENPRYTPDPPPISERARWLETAGHMALELYRMKYQIDLLRRACPGEEGVFHGFEREFLEKVNDLICRKLGWEVTHNEDLPEWNEGDRAVYICNHPTLTACWPWAHFMSKNFAHNMVAVGKDNIIKNRSSRFFMGQVMLDSEKVLFINRGDRDEALQTIRDNVERLLVPDTGAIILPDEHRPWAGRVRKDQKKWDAKDPSLKVGEWLKRTCFPKSGGLWAMAQGLEGLDDVRFFDCTVVEPATTHEYGGRIHFDVREISRKELLGEPESEENLREKLVEMWRRKNAM